MITFAPCLFLITFLTSISGSLQATCDENEFQCKNVSCIDSFLVCDGEKNCPDGSDETKALCSTANIRCPSYSFRCAYGPCIDGSKKCNKVQDCADNSDETHPDCGGDTTQYNNGSSAGGGCSQLTQFQCDSGQCITQYSVCDGEENCRDGSDETEARCINFNCPIVGFQCSYGGCIDKDKKCNGIKDCKDNSDEDPSICAPQQPDYPTGSVPFKPGSSKGCILPDFPESGSYTVGDCPDRRNPKCRREPGTLVEHGTFIEYSCWKNFGLSSDLSNKSYCFISDWDPPLPKCLRLCRPLKDDSLIIKCTYKDSPVNCNLPVKPTTKAKIRCKHYHTSQDIAYRDNPECLENGDWSERPFTCKAECGKRTSNNVVKLISGGVSVQAPDFPWYVGLYNIKTKEHFCGGSIISPVAVLTAAHCLFPPGNEARAPLDNSLIRLTVGKTNRSWTIKEDYEQRFEVAQKHIHPSYDGKGFSYGFDLAVLTIKGYITVGDFAMPVCWEQNPPWTTIHPGQNGTVVGFGKDAKGQATFNLTAVNVAYAGTKECQRMAPVDFKDYVTLDKFCGFYKNEAGPQQGDSGGGIVFLKPENGLYFIRGVVSTKPQDRNQFATFTNISYKLHSDFIKETMREITRYRNELQTRL